MTQQQCPHCGNEILTTARVCQHCKEDVLFQISLQQRVQDTRLAHELAKQIVHSAGKTQVGDYQELKKLLRDTGKPLVSFLSRQEADFFSTILHRHNLAHQILPCHTPGRSGRKGGGRRFWQLSLTLLGLAAAGALVYLHFFHNRQATPTGAEGRASYEFEHTTPGKSAPQGTKQLTDKDLPRNIKLTAKNIRQLISATVMISDGRRLGSGFFVSADGHFITNEHVIRDMRHPMVTLYDGRNKPGRLLAQDRSLDLALLKVEGQDIPHLPLGDATMLNQGDTVWTIGSPHGLKFTLTKGIVSYVGRKLNGKAYIQSDVAINKGNSGGPMLNDQGEVVGINTFIISQAEGLNFALPINYTYMGSSAMLAQVIGQRPVNQTFADWTRAKSQNMRYASEQNPSQPAPTRPGSGPSTANKQLAEAYLKDQQLYDNFNSRKTRQEQELSALKSRQATLNSQYQEAMATMTISEETKLGKRVKELDLQVTRQEIELYQTYADYYDKRKRVLRGILGVENDTQKTKMIRRELQNTEQLQTTMQSNLATAKATLEELRAKKY